MFFIVEYMSQFSTKNYNLKDLRMKEIYSTTLFAITLLTCNIAVSAQEVAPMLATKYSQTAPYNNSCPNNSAAGCGPVAIAQILTKLKFRK